MINLFRTLNPLNILVLIVLAALLRLGIIIDPPESLSFSIFESYASALLNINTQGIFSVEANLFLALAVTLLQAFVFNRVVNEFNLLGKPSFLPALMYVVGSSLLVHFLVLSPVLICNFLMIWMLYKFLSIHRKETALGTMFDLGMIIAIGALIYLPFASMMILLWISLLIFRPFNWREWVAGVTGFVTVYFFIAVAYYWTDSEALQNFRVPLAIHFKLFQVNLYDYLVLLPVVLVLFLSVISLQQKLYRSSIHIRKSYAMLFFTLLFALLSFFITSKYQVYHFLLAVPAAAVFMAFYFVSSQRRWLYESLFVLMAGSIIYFQFV